MESMGWDIVEFGEENSVAGDYLGHRYEVLIQL